MLYILRLLSKQVDVRNVLHLCVMKELTRKEKASRIQRKPIFWHFLCSDTFTLFITLLLYLLHLLNLTLREKCIYSQFFWSVLSRIRTEYDLISLRIQSERGKIRTRKVSE